MGSLEPICIPGGVEGRTDTRSPGHTGESSKETQLLYEPADTPLGSKGHPKVFLQGLALFPSTDTGSAFGFGGDIWP